MSIKIHVLKKNLLLNLTVAFVDILIAQSRILQFYYRDYLDECQGIHLVILPVRRGAH